MLFARRCSPLASPRRSEPRLRTARRSDAESRRFVTAKRCMVAIDADRLQALREAHGYAHTWMGSLRPLDCSPKNNVICGVAAS